MTARSVSLGCLLAFVVATATAPAASAAGEVGLSKDGVTWSASLPQPLFTLPVLWVPGDEEVSRFFVRNQGPTNAQLTIAAHSGDTDRLLANDDIDLFARANDGPWVELRNGEPSQSLTRQALARGGVVPVDVRAVFDPASVNPSQTKKLELRFVVTLADTAADADNSDDDDSDDSDDGDRSGLPGTGSSVKPQALWVAALLIGGGLALVRRSRTEEGADV